MLRQNVRAVPDIADLEAARFEFDAQFERTSARLLRIAASFVGPDGADDVVQETYLQGRRRFAQLRDRAAYQSWITRIAVNLALSDHRRRKRLRDLLPSLLPSRATATDLGLRELVERLPARERTVLVLHYGHGYRLDEIATRLELTHTNVKTIIARTRKRLYTALA